jgi:hypothetical protein
MGVPGGADQAGGRPPSPPLLRYLTQEELARFRKCTRNSTVAPTRAPVCAPWAACRATIPPPEQGP